MLCREKKTCRLCDSQQLEPVFKLPDTPPANAFVSTWGVPQEKYPLEVMSCRLCGHSQLRHVVDPKLLFNDYLYVSGTSPSFVKHFEEYAKTVRALLPTKKSPYVVEIGSNDGTLLKAFKNLGCRVQGIEPAEKIAQRAREDGIPTICDFFSSSMPGFDPGPADIVVANNVLAHVDNLHDVAEGVRKMLTPNGLFVFEVQHVEALLKQGLFDMVYHEHLDYHAIGPLIPFFLKHGLQLVQVDEVNTHGGSIRGYVQHIGGPFGGNLDRLNAQTSTLSGPTDWTRLQNLVISRGAEVRAVLDTFATRRAMVVGYGAPAKLTTFMYGLGLTAKDFAYVVDDSPLKQGLFTPGLHVPVVPPERLYHTEHGWPDAIVICAWNFARAIMEKHKQLNEEGTHWVIPLPQLEVTP